MRCVSVPVWNQHLSACPTLPASFCCLLSHAVCEKAIQKVQEQKGLAGFELRGQIHFRVRRTRDCTQHRIDVRAAAGQYVHHLITSRHFPFACELIELG